MSRHPERQQLAHFYGASDIVEECGEEGVARIKEPTGGLGAHSVVEAVGTQESFMQAVGATRGGGHLGYVGVNHDVQIPGIELFFAGIHALGGPAPVRRYLCRRRRPSENCPHDRLRRAVRLIRAARTWA